MGKVVRMSETKKNENVEEILEEVVEDTENVSSDQESSEKVVEPTQEDEVTALKAEVEKLKNEYIKVFADTENLKKRLQREHEQSTKYRIQSFALNILPTIDNLERALQQKTDDEAYREGVVMIYDQLMASLKAEGVEAIEALNKPFDPNIHQAMMMESVEGVEPNTVVEEYQKGYMLKDRILRASLVKVSE